MHIVKSGESLYALARMYGLSVQEIRQANALDSEILHIGQQILIPEQNQTSVNPVSLPPSPVVSPSPPPPSPLSELPWDLKSVLEARRIIQLEASSGYEIMGGGLRGAVGRNRVNRAEDLQKVQLRLVQLNMLKHNHGESPEAIMQKIGGKGALTANYIPLTIQAIERMQEQFKVRFWIEHTSRVAMMKTNSYTQGVVVPGDVTERFMNEYTEYRLSFPHPHGGQTVSIRFHNFPRSAHTQYYHGVSYAGISNPEIPMEVFRRLGANETLAEALSFVSRHEGKFDAINSYDRAIFSFGFIQFAGNGGGLVPLLAAIKQKAPKVFEEYFQQFGLDVEYREHLGQIQQAELRVANPHDRGGKFILRGQEAERVLRADKVLHGVFIRAGHYLPVVTLQIDAALQHYVKPALHLSLNLVLGTLRLSNATLTDYINSALGLTMLIDLSINRWINTARQVFQEAIEKVARREKIFTQEALRQIDERLVVAQIIADAQQKRDDLLVKRASNIYNSGLSTQKSPEAAVIRPS
ncbi:MAG: LysM peptidoglycan-binding domain-containing protein [Microscillaceae bacterium]|nr:LysM peptidoglycan-binding domain-containing protein [Microscillaceae bacterium]